MAATDPQTGYEIVGREDFSDAAYSLTIKHPLMATAVQPGQFVIVSPYETGERLPLTVADFDRDEGTISLVVMAVGKTARAMQQTCRIGSSLSAVTGPIGVPGSLRAADKVVCIGGGLGVAPIFPLVSGLHAGGTQVISVLGFRTENLVFWKDRFEANCDELILCTDDGSSGFKGLVSDGIAGVMEAHSDIDEVIAVGPPLMMKAVADVTRPHGIKTTVSLSPIMVDGAGKCAGCRILLGNETYFACVDGPYFDAHLLDFDDLIGRIRRYAKEGKAETEGWSDQCRMMCEIITEGGEGAATQDSSETLLTLLELPDPFDEAFGG